MGNACLSSMSDIKRLKMGVTINKYCIPEGGLRESVDYKDLVINVTTKHYRGPLVNLSSGYAQSFNLWHIQALSSILMAIFCQEDLPCIS